VAKLLDFCLHLWSHIRNFMSAKLAARLLLLAVLNLSLAHAASPILIGSDFSGVIYDVDPNTGACTNPRGTGLDQVAGFTVTADGTHAYALTSFGSAIPNSFFSVNPYTGATTLIGSTGFSTISEGDLCIRPSDGTFFALDNIVGADLHLFTINPATGAGTDVGAVATSTDLSALAFAPDGSLYCFENGLQLRKLNPNTGATLMTINLTGITTATGAAGMAFGPDGTCYITCRTEAGPSLYTANLTTGAMTRLGATTYGDGWGLSSLTVVPEPGAALLLVMGGLVLCWRRKAAF
jgi:hypothetical protein